MKRAFVPLTSAALLFLSACHLARGTPEPAVSGDNEADQQTLIALAVQQTQTAQVALIPLLPTETPSITLSPTPQLVMVTVSVATNCRTGPGEPYEIVGALSPGIPAEVIGRNASGDTWIIKLPSNPAVTCWLWGYYATVTGDTSGLTIHTPPPTPTPAIGFTVSYRSSLTCEGTYCFTFTLVNTGSITWESYRLVMYDSNTSTTTTYQQDVFGDYDCWGTISQWDDLEPGEAGVTGNYGTGLFHYNPIGHNMTATFTVCSLEGQAGTCVDKSITFTP